jgi:OFA family oxalate/formate antiporter-like MFS transporter
LSELPDGFQTKWLYHPHLTLGDMMLHQSTPGDGDAPKMQNSRQDMAIPRAMIAAAAFCMQLALGAVYAWSVFVNPLREHFAASKVEVSLTFTITIAVLGVTAAFGGDLQRRFGPRAIASVAALFYGAGVLLSGIAPDLATLYLTYGVLGGVGLGLGYIVPLAVLIGWFPDRRGFITGLAVAGFGLGALVTGPLATELVKTFGIQLTFIALGAAYLVIVAVAAQFMRSAPENYQPAGWTPPVQQALTSAAQMTLPQALRSPHWYFLWLMLALNVTAGSALISVAVPLTEEWLQVSSGFAAVTVCLISLFNGLGRLFWGTLSDRVGRSTTFLALFLLQAVAFMLLPAMEHIAALLGPTAMTAAFLELFAVIALCFGGGFGTMPAFATDVFGARNAGAIYGAMLTAWSAGSIAGPMLIAAIPYQTALALIAWILVIAAALPLLFHALFECNEATDTESLHLRPRLVPVEG